MKLTLLVAAMLAFAVTYLFKSLEAALWVMVGFGLVLVIGSLILDALEPALFGAVGALVSLGLLALMERLQ